MIYFTSDLHFGHDRGFMYRPRGFSDSLSHDLALVENWNKIVTDKDTVYILGDLMLNDNNWGMFLLRKLKGEKHIIIGNHDTPSRVEMYKEIGDVKYADVIKYGKYSFYLSHYPTFTSSLKKESLKHCLINMHGHLHQKSKFYNDIPFMYNVSMDSHNNKPVSIEEALQDMKNKVEECRRQL